jgi:hypothetical protein
MTEARNVTAMKEWVAENRPDLTDQFEIVFAGRGAVSDAYILLMTTAFEAGRMFQSKTADATRYVPMEEMY